MTQAIRLPSSRNMILLVLATGLSPGCASMSNTDKGVVGGGLVGAGTGAAIGHALGNTGAGAVIGTAVGAIAGGAAGNAVDRAEHKAEVAQAQAQALAAQRQLGMTDVVSLTHQHISDPIIIQQIRSSGSVFQLSAADIQFLKSQGVSDAVVMEMQATASRPVKRVYTAEPVYPAGGVYIYQPPPPLSVGFGVGYHRHRRCW